MINHHDLLEIAQSFSKYSFFESQAELYYRIAANRAYYFIFHHVKEYFGKSNALRISHGRLIGQLGKSKDSSIREAWALMKLCKLIREEADYQNFTEFDQSKANLALTYAEKIKELLTKKETVN